MYIYRCRINKVVDGDTLNLTIDLGFTTYWKSNCRLAGINTPELTAVDEAVRAKANEAKQYVASKLVSSLGAPVQIYIISKTLDNYGRPLVDVYYGPGFSQHLNQELLDKGLAVKYP